MSQPNILKEFVEPADLRRHIFDTEFRLVDTLILATLSKNPAHGYGLQAQIENFSFGRVSLGSASIYRTLRRMCRDGLIVPLAKEPGERTRYMILPRRDVISWDGIWHYCAGYLRRSI